MPFFVSWGFYEEQKGFRLVSKKEMPTKLYAVIKLSSMFGGKNTNTACRVRRHGGVQKSYTINLTFNSYLGL